MEYKIAIIKGDGIGSEVVDQAVLVLDAIAKRFEKKFVYEYLLAGGAAIDDSGEPLPEYTVEKCKDSDAVLLGAVGGPKWDDQPGNNRPEMAILGLREKLELYANLRPAIVFEELKDACPLKDEKIEGGLDILIVRELTGGIYFGPKATGEISENGASKDSIINSLIAGRDVKPGRFAYDVEQYSEKEIIRIAESAFDFAMRRGKHVTSVEKSNVLESSRLWKKVITEVHENYPEVKLDHMYVDNAAMQLINNPRQFDVIVTNNIFGDILSDEASQITGSIGMLPSASLGLKSFGLYEPIHGSAPDIAGQDIANPIATILSAAMLLRFSLGLIDEADCIENAVAKLLEQGYRTPDIMSEGKKLVGTKDTGNEIVRIILENSK